MLNKLYEKVRQTLKENWKFIFSLIILFLVFKIELPFVIYTPGGSIDLNKRIEVENSTSVDGSFSMAYVSMVRGNVPFLLMSFIVPNWDIVSKDRLTYDKSESVADVLERDKFYLQEANDNATFVAYRYANKEIMVNSSNKVIVYLSKEADSDLKLFDEIVSVDSILYTDVEGLRAYIQTKNINDILVFKIIRNNKEIDVEVSVYEEKDSLMVGISTLVLYDYETEPDLEIKNKSSESGPSGGLMTALSIYNYLIEEDITYGKSIIGTGTIAEDGTVGIIGGVKYKLLGAEKKKADLFICPKENLEEALEVKRKEKLDIEIIGVSTFEEALNELAKLK